MSRYLHYVMLNVGEVQRVERTDIADEAIDYIGPMLQDEGLHRANLPSLPFDTVIRHEGPALFVRVIDADATIAAFAVVTRGRGSVGGNLWMRLHDLDLDRLATSPDDGPPAAPWAGLALSRDLRSRHRDVVHGIIALTKSSAWAWIESRTDD